MTKLLIQIFQDLTVITKGLKDGKVNRVYVSLWLTAVSHNFILEKGITVNKVLKDLISLYLFILYACLIAFLYPINVKTAIPIEPKFDVGPHMTQGKVCGWSKISKISLWQNKISIKLSKNSLIFLFFMFPIEKELMGARKKIEFWIKIFQILQRSMLEYKVNFPEKPSLKNVNQ